MSVTLALFNPDGSARQWEEVVLGIQAAVNAKRSDLRLVGPEPTRSPDLLRAIGACRSAGLEVELETDAIALAASGRAELLLSAGLSGIHARLWGCSPATHDARAGVGSFKRSLQGLRAARQGGLKVALIFGLNRFNVSEIPRAVELAGSLEARLVTLERDPLVGMPGAPELADSVNKAVESGLGLGISLKRVGVPPIASELAWKLHHNTFDSAVYALLKGDLVERPRTPLYAVGIRGDTKGFLDQTAAVGGVRELCHTLEAAGAPLVDLPPCLGGFSAERPERVGAERAKHERCQSCIQQTTCLGADTRLGEAVRAALAPRRDWLKRPREGRIELVGFDDVADFELEWTYADLARQLEALGHEVSFREVADAGQRGNANLYVFPDYAQLSKNYDVVQNSDSSAIVLDFHLLTGIEELRARCGLPALGSDRAGAGPDLEDRLPPNVTIVSCFPGYTKLYRNAGVPLQRVTWHPYAVALTNLPDALPVLQAKSFSCGGNHLRDWATFFESMRLFEPRHAWQAFGDPEASQPDFPVSHLELDEFWAALARSRFVVVPLEYDWSRPAGITVMMMAQVVGRPIIATRTPGTEDHLTHGEDSLLVPAGDARALADAMALLDRDDTECERLAAGALRSREKASTASLARCLTQGRSQAPRLGHGPYHVW